MATQLQIKNITYSMPSCIRPGHLSLADATFEAIFLEILDNAKKFHPQQDPLVNVTVAPVPSEARAIRVQIQDDGVWLSPEQIKWAMTPYVQGEKYFTGEARGLGLGLSLVNTLVMEAGGEVRLRNRADRPGVVLELDIPFADNFIDKDGPDEG